MVVRGLVAALLCAGLGFQPVYATTVVIPDDLSSIQQGIDSGADSVLIRPGDYSETVVVSQPGVLLIGAPSGSHDIPTIEGLRIEIYRSASYPALYAFKDIRFLNPVVYYNNRNNSDIAFSGCELRGGMVDTTAGHADTGDITFFGCRLDGLIGLIAKGRIGLDSCQVTGHLVAGVSPSSVEVRDCTFQGDGNYIALYADGPSACRVEDNTIRGYLTGVAARSDYSTLVRNTVEDCLSTGMLGAGGEVRVENNIVRRCGRGIYAEAMTAMWIIGNSVTGCNNGVEIGDASEAEVTGNVAWRCSGSGIVVRNASGRLYVKVMQNTSCLNGLSGFVVDSFSQWGQEWSGNIGCANAGHGINWLRADAAVIGCNDWFGNVAGDVQGRPPSGADFSVDPQFCGADSDDFRLSSASPLVDWAGCGQIGALGVGCGLTPTLVQRFTAGRVSGGIRVVWEVVEGATASEVWVERSEGTSRGPWTRPVTVRSTDNRAVVELDGSAASERAYWYRLVALEGRNSVVIGAPILVEAQARAEFRLVEVGPNPGGGSVRIAFALQHAAAVQIDVFDLLGRRVASPAEGVWLAGTHSVEWNALTRNGKPAPGGLYLLRYAYPGGQDSRRIVISR